VKITKYAEGITSFKSALNVRPGDTVALARIADAEKQLALAGEKAKNDAEYARLIAEGDANVKITKYAEGITSFKSALNVRPGDTVALARIADAEKQLALAGEKAKNDAEYTRLIAEGDANVKITKYAEGITSFKSALNVRPGDTVALARIADAEKQLALAGEKAKNDAEYSRLLAEGDANVKITKYAEGITSFKSALNVRPGDAVALARITDAEKQLALAGEKAKNDAEYTRLIADGDASVKITKYAEGITSFKSALNVRPGDAVALERIADAEKLIIASKQQKYKETVEKADQLFASKSYPGSKQLYQQALALDPAPTYPADRIREIDKIIAAQLQADAHARELENAKTKLYNDAVNRGEAYFMAKQYPDAISAYTDAQKIKPSEIVPPQKIKEIQSIIDALAAKALDDKRSATESKLSSAEKSYLEKIRLADENFKNSQWTVARFYYIESLKYKKGDNYSLEKVDACDKLIGSGITAEKMQEYNSKITKADDDLKAQNYSSAKFYYRGASDILKWETYPIKQLKEIDRIVTEKLNESDQKLFKENLDKADDAFSHLEYTVARFYYNKASQIIQSDHVVSRLKEIESITNGSEAKIRDASYDDFIKKGDDAVKQNNSSIARFYFQKASILKPNENYPKEQLKKLDSETDNP
jgi:hypothetical protein